MDKPKETLDTILDDLLMETARQLLSKVQEGEDLRAAIDFLKFHRHNRPEGEELKTKKDPSALLEGLVDELGLDQAVGKVRR